MQTCSKCKTNPRRSYHSWCMSCAKQSNAKYNNTPTGKAARARWIANNPQYHKRWRETHQDYIIAYRETNKEEIKAHRERLGYFTYEITNIVNGAKYYGQTKMADRWLSHKANVHSKTITQRNCPLYVAMREFGVENFTFNIIQQHPDKKSARAHELELIKAARESNQQIYNSPKARK